MAKAAPKTSPVATQEFDCIEDAYAALMQQENVLVALYEQEEEVRAKAEALYPECPPEITIITNRGQPNEARRPGSLEDINRDCDRICEIWPARGEAKRLKAMIAHADWHHRIKKVDEAVGLSAIVGLTDSEIDVRDQMVRKVLDRDINRVSDMFYWLKTAKMFAELEDEVDKLVDDMKQYDLAV